MATSAHWSRCEIGGCCVIEAGMDRPRPIYFMKSKLAQGLKMRLRRNLYRASGLVLTRSMQYLERERQPYTYGDYVRESSLELVAQEIHAANIPGSVCELGVYRGDFSARINAAFKDRRLYLFDTFEGFSEKDKDIEIDNNFSFAAQDFSDTCIDTVIKKMKYPENIVIRKGHFPTTLLDSDAAEIFAFVSLDADLYHPIYEGLRFFYPRLSRGGYIFVHDYNNIHYAGVKAAVKRYCGDNGLGYFPLTDPCGSVIISK